MKTDTAFLLPPHKPLKRKNFGSCATEPLALPVTPNQRSAFSGSTQVAIEWSKGIS
jgi:hypothetical protein